MIDVILTHEQADFDALGAALGAYLMNEKAVPVTPRRMNRNVRAFLTLYGAELPFIDPRDLPGEPIRSVTLTDTQSLVTLKGMSRKTSVQVVDHHSLRPDLPETWHVTIDPVGACTTLFVEGLREHNGVLNPTHATLLLLGIYEDTGSLSYVSTTSRDMRAAAYLLEQGASLQIVTRYLNPPLSNEQRLVYDRLLSSARRLPIHGHNILVAAADAADLVDEISTIAHKMRDLLDPDALFLLVGTVEGIRLVARSVTDSLNVAEVAEVFGGGGHGRAAAALIRVEEEMAPDGRPVRKPDLDEVLNRLLELLPRHIQPAATVRQMMSPHPLVLSPDTSAEKALHLMQRYGYEGYPVVDKGKVVGLLTRRAVDRAISHHLNLPASSLMEAGEVTVQPDDSLEHLRRVMIDSGWGQVPVVEADNEHPVGIVTRTDLLKTLSGSIPTGSKQNLAARLEAALPPTRLSLLQAVAACAHQHKVAVYIVGGFVRDLLLERPSFDFDVVVEGDAISLAGVLASQYGGQVQSHSRFGTAKWNIAQVREDLARLIANTANGIDPDDLPDSLDLISARTEFYDYPTALPTVERSSIKLDLHRRDFTINTMALRLDGRHYGELYDYWGGLRDLRRGLIRVLHSLSFVDDPTRLMRAVRFEQRFGFEIEERTQQLMHEARQIVRQVSGDRLRHELNLILEEQRPQPVLARLDALELLGAIHPAFNWPEALTDPFDIILHQGPDPCWNLPDKTGNLNTRHALAYLAWLLYYPSEIGLVISQRLRLPGDLADSLGAAHRLRDEMERLICQPPSQATAVLDSIPTLALACLDITSQDAVHKQFLHTYAQIWRTIWPTKTGDDLRALKIPPGPQYRVVLASLRAAWLDGKIKSAADEQALFDQLVADLTAAGSP